MSDRPTVVVTGAAGTIGTALRTRLPDHGWTVRWVDRERAQGVQFADVSSRADLDEVVPGASAIVHLAPRQKFCGPPRLSVFSGATSRGSVMDITRPSDVRPAVSPICPDFRTSSRV